MSPFISRDIYRHSCTVTGALYKGDRLGRLFDGIDDKITMTVPSLANSDITLAAWVNRTDTGRYDFILGLGNDADNDYKSLYFRYSNINVILYGTKGDSPTYTPATPTSGAWVFWLWTQNATTKARVLYENGVAVDSNTATSAYIGTGTTLHIGEKSNDAGQNFKGSIGEAWVYSKVLSAGEVYYMHKATEGRYV